MTFGSCSSPARIIAGSPGSSCCSPKISIDTKTSVGTIVAEAPDEEARTSRASASARRRRGAPSSGPVTRSSPSGMLRTPLSLAL